MNKDDKTFQQQILFDDVTLDEKTHDKVNTENPSFENMNSAKGQAPLYFSEADFINDAKQEEYFKEAPASQSKPRLLWSLFSITTLVLVIAELVAFVQEGMASAPIMTSLYCIVIGCVVLMLSKVLLGEFSSLRKYKRQRLTQDKIKQVMQSDLENTQSAQVLCSKITEQLPSDLSMATSELWKKSEGLSEPEIISVYSRQILSKVDEKALAEISKYSSETVVLISLSPIAVLDMILMLWRNLTMLDKIAGLYGLKLTYWTRIALIKDAFKNMLYAGASELMVDLGADALGGEILGKLSTRLAQGLGAGMLTARLGLKAMYLCRPIPFDDAPKLSSLRKHVLSQVKALLVSSSSKNKDSSA